MLEVVGGETFVEGNVWGKKTFARIFFPGEWEEGREIFLKKNRRNNVCEREYLEELAFVTRSVRVSENVCVMEYSAEGNVCDEEKCTGEGKRLEGKEGILEKPFLEREMEREGKVRIKTSE